MILNEVTSINGYISPA